MELENNAIICEIPKAGKIGAFYKVNVRWVPRAGELINLTTLLDPAEKQSPFRHYEVVQVVHKLTDHTPKFPHTEESHFVRIYVKPISSKYFE